MNRCAEEMDRFCTRILHSWADSNFSSFHFSGEKKSCIMPEHGKMHTIRGPHSWLRIKVKTMTTSNRHQANGTMVKGISTSVGPNTQTSPGLATSRGRKCCDVHCNRSGHQRNTLLLLFPKKSFSGRNNTISPERWRKLSLPFLLAS